MKIKENKLLLLSKDRQNDSIFRLLPDSYWEEIEFDATPVLLKKLKKIKDKYLYSISVPALPGMYMEAGEIEIPIEKEEEFLKIFEDDIEEIKKIEEILGFKFFMKNKDLFDNFQK